MAHVSDTFQLKIIQITLFSLSKNNFKPGTWMLIQFVKGLKKQVLG